MGAQPEAPRHPIRTLLLDLDDTIYQVEEIPEMVRHAIHDYMEQKLAIPRDQIPAMCLEYYTAHGTTMAGLVEKGFQIDFDDWHAAVHGALPYHRLLKRDEGLRQLLQSIPLPKYVFTNADRKHADTCLELMGIADLFQGIICFETLMEMGRQTRHVVDNKPVVCKPNQLAFEMALKAAGADTATSVFCDDSTRNVKAARAAGIFSVLVGRCGADCGADLEVPNLAALRQALPGLWQRPSCSSSIRLLPGGSTPATARGVPPVAKGQGVQEEPLDGSASGQLLEESRSQEITVAAGR